MKKQSNRERNLQSIGTLFKWPQLLSLELLPGLPLEWRDPNIWAICSLFPKCINREVHQK